LRRSGVRGIRRALRKVLIVEAAPARKLRGAPPVDEVRVNGVPLNEVEALEIRPGADSGWTLDQDGTVRVMNVRG
jgi:hypothetical protein